MRPVLMAAGVAALALCSGSAHAQGPGGQGLFVMVGGGVEGYTQELAPQIRLGVTYEAVVGLRASRRVGLEIGYSGAVSRLVSPQTAGTGTGGANLVRNGAYAAATVGFLPTAVQPYVLGGLGFSHYNVRGGLAGFNDDTVGNLPLGLGVRTAFGSFTADARLAYNFFFDQRFATRVRVPGGAASLSVSRSGRYSGTLHFGVAW
jgi:hypothetical protein